MYVGQGLANICFEQQQSRHRGGQAGAIHSRLQEGWRCGVLKHWWPALLQTRVILWVDGLVANVIFCFKLCQFTTRMRSGIHLLTIVVAGVEPLAVLSRQVDLTLTLHKLYTQTHGNVERNMTVHQPCSRVVGRVGYH